MARRWPDRILPRDSRVLAHCSRRSWRAKRETSLPTLWCPEVPARPVALGIEFDECGCASANCAQDDRLVGIGHDLGLNAVGAVGQLINLPKLLGSARVRRHSHDLAI